jgi:hypothetical protein
MFNMEHVSSISPSTSDSGKGLYLVKTIHSGGPYTPVPKHIALEMMGKINE